MNKTNFLILFMSENKYKVGHPEFIREATRLGLTGYQYHQKLIERGLLISPIDIEHRYRNSLAKKHGYEDRNERERDTYNKKDQNSRTDYQNNYYWNKGTRIPMSENENCPQYLGIHIVENIVPKIFQDPIRMPYRNPGYDWICKKGFKIDYKSSVLLEDRKWGFNIRYNNIADYFILVAFDNRENLNPIHIWLIGRNDIIRGRKFYRRDKFYITNDPEYLTELQKYEIIDKLEILKECCNKLKNKTN